MIKTPTYKKLAIIVILVILAIYPTAFLKAQTSQELGQEIDQQQKDLDKSQKDLEDIQNKLKDYQSAIDNSSGELPKLEAQINQKDAEIKSKTLELQLIKESKKLSELEKQKVQIDQQETLKTSYMDWRVLGFGVAQIINTDIDYKKIEQYSSSFTGAQQKNIGKLTNDLKKIVSDISSYDKKIKELDKDKQSLAQQKQDLENQIAYLNGALASGNQAASNLGASIQNIQKNIDGLVVEQQQAKQREDQILANPPPKVDPGQPVVGGFVFRSQGRDLYQGHGVGMSQWGANGLALHGYTFDNILKFYYTGVSVVGGYDNTTINVDGYGSMNLDTYAAGQGEVPSKACGTSAQVSSRPDKYVTDDPNSSFDCWPEEAIKAQVVAFKTYALNYIKSHGSICATASCQVYNGTQNSKWAADETKGLAITYGGSIIEALYSADNSQGNGTANNDTIFQNVQGDGTPYAYLRSVNDNGLATSTYWTFWGTKTNQYNLDGVKSMILYNAGTNYYDSSTKSYLNSIISNIGGSISSISFERDPSQRVKKVWFKGPNGNSMSLGGWWFKNLWNSWTYDMGTYDYIYSQTFFLENP